MRSCGKNVSRWLLQQKEAAHNLPPPARAMTQCALNSRDFGAPLGPDTLPPEPEDVTNMDPQTIVGDLNMARAPVQETITEVGILQFHSACYL
jgi:hypothetical protein